MTPKPCTTHSRTRRHYSILLRPSEWHGAAGREGPTLCGDDGFDQEFADREALYMGARDVVIADLPPCRKCAKAAEKLGGAS